MRRIVNSLIRSVVRSDVGWYFGKMTMRFAEWLRYERSLYEHELSERRLSVLFSDLTVRKGYFEGLKYAGYGCFGSSLYPKLCGSYESELTDVFEALEGNEYQEIIDVGCAEGYYAIGLAKKHAKVPVYAFDISANARKLCGEMAAINGVADRMIIKEECTPEWLENLDANVRRLLICDCEGYERKLFGKKNAAALAKCDLVIELHPMFYRDVKEYLADLFRNTHSISYVSSYDDARKIFDLDDCCASLSELDKIKLVQEGRSFCMDWMIATANQ